MQPKQTHAPVTTSKIFLVTTTIHVPDVLRRYRSLRPDMQMIIIGDKKSPDDEIKTFVKSLGNALYLNTEDQEKLGYKSSKLIGWNSIQRRNIGFLEALKHGADIIISVDDDNIPMDEHYVEQFVTLLTKPYQGLALTSPTGWINIGEFLKPKIYHRGFPYDFRHKDLQYSLHLVADARIGVAAGLWLGDPDIDAMERITNRPIVHDVTDIATHGVIISPDSVSPFNSQNTAYIRELAPLFMMLTGVGRYDDIWSSYIMQRVMNTTGHVVHFGRPFVWQERNAQSLWKNLRDELYGMEHTLQFCTDLNSIEIPHNTTVVEKLTYLYKQLKRHTYLPPVVFDIADAWLKDLQTIY